MPFAANNRIGMLPIDGGIAITQEQYNEALAAIQDGKVVAIVDGALVLQDPPMPEEPEQPEVPSVPQEITRLQAMLQLQIDGKLAAVQAYMVDPLTDPLHVIAWENASAFRRDSPTILAVAPAVGINEAQLDDMFKAAALLTA